MTQVVEETLIPENWVRLPLGELIKLEYGKGLTAKTRVGTGNVPVYGSSGDVGRHDEAYIQEPCIIVGRKGNVGHVFISQQPCWPIDTVYFVIPPDGLDIKYLYYQLKNINLARLDRSTAIPGINRGDVYKVDFYLAPPKQQKRIVAKIEELFSHIDAGIAALNKTKKLLKQYRQSVLKAAVTGELTKQWREENKDKLEPASQLLERILIERREKWEAQQLAQFEAKGKTPKNDKWKDKYKEPLLPAFDHISDVPDIPNTWAWVTLSQLTSVVKDGPHYSPKYAEKGIPFITGGNVRPYGVDFENCKYITQELHEELSRRCKPELNDILYTKGGTTGIARVNTYDKEFNVWVHVAVLRLVNNKYLTPFYVQHSLNSHLCYSQSQKYTHGVGNQDLGLTRMIKICMALPPVEEQELIVRIIDQKIDSIDRIEKQVAQMLIQGEKNKQAILATAFSGELVDGQEGDRDAKDLLKEIEKQQVLNKAKARLDKKRKPAKKRDVKLEKKEIISILKSSSEPIAATDLFDLTGRNGETPDEVENFYIELKAVLADPNVVIETVLENNIKQGERLSYKEEK